MDHKTNRETNRETNRKTNRKTKHETKHETKRETKRETNCEIDGVPTDFFNLDAPAQKTGPTPEERQLVKKAYRCLNGPGRVISLNQLFSVLSHYCEESTRVARTGHLEDIIVNGICGGRWGVFLGHTYAVYQTELPIRCYEIAVAAQNFRISRMTNSPLRGQCEDPLLDKRIDTQDEPELSLWDWIAAAPPNLPLRTILRICIEESVDVLVLLKHCHYNLLMIRAQEEGCLKELATLLRISGLGAWPLVQDELRTAQAADESASLDDY